MIPCGCLKRGLFCRPEESGFDKMVIDLTGDTDDEGPDKEIRKRQRRFIG